MSGALVRRFHKKMDSIPALCRRLTLKQAKRIERAFVEALKEELDVRFRDTIPSDGDPLYRRPLVIAGLGSFKMRTRGERKFDVWNGTGNAFGNDVLRQTVTKPPARRLVFTSKWEPLRGWKFDGVVEGKTLKLTMTKEPTP